MEKDKQYEQQHLQEIQDIIYEMLDDLLERIEASEKDLDFSKDEFGNETSHAIGGSLYGAESFEQLVELNQFMTQIAEDMSRQEIRIDERDELERLLLSPYFARINFTFSDEEEPTEIYIGRNSLVDEFDILIHDWRSPIAGLFYQYGLGQASYSAPAGTITGDISLKRQYEINDGRLEYFFDADIEIVDEYLRNRLSKNASPQMKSIVETIQREQDTAIRDDQNKVLMVQGVAGSGKTSVALHRIAYLMYKGLTDRLDSNDVIIISPNGVFEQYIAKVLPELGENSVRSFLPEDLFEKILGRKNIQSRAQVTEQILVNEGFWVPVMKRSLEFKCSQDFVQIINKVHVRGTDFKSVKEAYRNLFDIPGKLSKKAEEAGVDLPVDIEEIVNFTKENLGSRKLFFDDASALSYLYLRFMDVGSFSNIRQVVIDEAQDYYYIHFQIMKLLFPKAKYTILGDISQTVGKPESMDFYREVTDIINKEPNSLITLEKSFRCTNEIIEFSSKIMNIEVQAFGRTGNKPELVQVENEKDVDALVEDAQTYINEGYESVGIICKTLKESRKLFKLLNEKVDVKLFDDTNRDNLDGIFILPVYLAKGLEFDAALVWNSGSDNYGNNSDKSLLYIACTRALHELKLYYCK